MDFLDKIFKSDGTNNGYSNGWLSSASDEQLNTQREKVRLAHCSGDEHAWGILHRFDNELAKRASKGHENEEWKPPAHREDGWYLPNDDD